MRVSGGPGLVDEASCSLERRVLSWEAERSRWTEAFCQRGEFCRGGRGRPQSFLLASGSLRRTGPVEMADYNHLRSRANDTLQSALVLGSGSSCVWCMGVGGDEVGAQMPNINSVKNWKAHWTILCLGSTMPSKLWRYKDRDQSTEDTVYGGLDFKVAGLEALTIN